MFCDFGVFSYVRNVFFFYYKERVLRSGVDIVFGTPGRIKDLMNKGTLKLDNLKYIILDEVDRMLDMGFAPEVDAIISHAYKGKLNRKRLN